MNQLDNPTYIYVSDIQTQIFEIDRVAEEEVRKWRFVFADEKSG
jgi:hypothetical protein